MVKKVEFFEHTVLAFYLDSEYDKNTKYCKIRRVSISVQKPLLFLPRFSPSSGGNEGDMMNNLGKPVERQGRKAKWVYSAASPEHSL